MLVSLEEVRAELERIAKGRLSKEEVDEILSYVEDYGTERFSEGWDAAPDWD